MTTLRNALILLLASVTAPLFAGEPGIVATVNGQPITAAELEPLIAAKLLPVRQREYDVTMEAIHEIAFERLVAAEAAHRAMTVEELLKVEVADRAPQPTEDEIKLMLRYLAARLPPDPAEARKVVVESLRNQKVQERQAAFRESLFARGNVVANVLPPRARVTVAPNDPVRGDNDSPVTILEFSDFQCPYCVRSQPTISRLTAEFEGRVRLVFKQFPLTQIHENAQVAAEASLCAGDQKKFWEMHDWLFANTSSMSRDDIVKAAPGLGLDPAVFGRCIDEHHHAKDVEADIQEGLRIGVTGTPAFFVNGRLISGGGYEAFAAIVQQELALAAKPVQRSAKID